MDQSARPRETRRKLQKTFLPGRIEARERTPEKAQPKWPALQGQTFVQGIQGVFKPKATKPCLGMLIAENATAGTAGEGQKNRKKPESLLRRFRMGKMMPRNFCHICQKEKKTSC
jgi:hypothetical protein